MLSKKCSSKGFRLSSLVAMALMISATILARPSQAQTYSVLYNFTGGADGYYPEAGLTLVGTSNLYGGAGPNAIFRLRQMGTGWVFNPIYDFTGNDGGFVEGRLTVGPGGALYGASGYGGLSGCADGAGCGLIFSMRPPSSFCRSVSCPWTLTTLYEFNPQGRSGDGSAPMGGLIFDNTGNMYGTTISGGVGAGTVFELSPSQGGWVETVLYQFPGGAGGQYPNGNLVMDRSGNLIGTTQIGGADDCNGPACGIIFELTHTSNGWVASTVHTFTDGSDGAFPYGGLISDTSGNLYGTTSTGGVDGGGTVYELTPSSGGYTFHVLHSFTGAAGVFGPMGILAIDGSGSLYGTTNEEGVFNSGNLFKLTASGGNWTYTDLYDFTIGSSGRFPPDGPTLDGSGNLYGTTTFGGTGTACSGGCGVVWVFTP